jgi:hypothetical protein
MLTLPGYQDSTMKTSVLLFAACLALLAALLTGAWFWSSGRTVDLHAELRRSLIESEFGSAQFFNYATPAKMPDASRATTAAAALVNALADADKRVRGRAAALVRIGAPALPQVRRAVAEQPGHAHEYALAVLGYLGNADDAAFLARTASRFSGTTRSTAQRSTHMIRQLAAYRSEAVASDTGVALNVLGPNSNPE